MRLKVSQLKILIENFVNEAPSPKSPVKKTRKKSKALSSKAQGDKQGFIDLINSIQSSKKNFDYLRKKDTKLDFREKQLLDFFKENKKDMNNLLKAASKIIKEHNKEKKKKGSVDYSKFYDKALKITSPLQDGGFYQNYKVEIKEYKEKIGAYGEDLDKKAENERLTRAFNKAKEERKKERTAREEKAKSEVTDEEREAVRKKTRGNRILDKDLRKVIKNLDMVKAIFSTSDNKEKRIEAEDLIDNIYQDITGKPPGSLKESISLEKTINQFVTKLLSEDVRNKRALEDLKRLNSDEFLKHLSDNTGARKGVKSRIDTIEKIVQRYIDRKDGDMFDPNYDKDNFKDMEDTSNYQDPSAKQRRREARTELEIVEGHPNLSSMIDNYLKTSKDIKKILDAPGDLKDTKDKKKDQIILAIRKKFNSVQEFNEKILMIPLSQGDIDRYDQLNLNPKPTEEEEKERKKLEIKVEKHNRGRRLRDFVEFLVTGLGDPKTRQIRMTLLSNNFLEE